MNLFDTDGSKIKKEIISIYLFEDGGGEVCSRVRDGGERMGRGRVEGLGGGSAGHGQDIHYGSQSAHLATYFLPFQ
jgi:hypothetical protein